MPPTTVRSDSPPIVPSPDSGILPILVQEHTAPGPVGGCLSQHLPAWKEMGADPWALNILEHGYAPTFKKGRPSLTHLWRSHESSTPRKAEMLQSSVDEMLLKNAIEMVRQPTSLGFYSHVFLVIKKNGKFRPVINLRALNQTLHVPTFSMETVASISAAAVPGDWAISLDLSDGYFHIPIARWFRKYLRFVINGRTYQFRALPFGLATAPRVFTKMLAPLASYLHSLGIPFNRFIDDFLVRGPTLDQLIDWAITVILALCKQGWHIGLLKSMLDPTQDFVYIGVRFLTSLGLILPPDDRIQKILECITRVVDQDPAPARTWLSLLGLLGSAEKQVPLGRLYIRPLQLCLHSQFSILSDPMEAPVALNPECLASLQWWSSLENISKGTPMGPFSPDYAVFTDASMTSWGAHCEDLTFSGDWSPQERHRSINQLELLAVIRTLEALPPHFSGSKLMLATDNSTTVAYINKFGGTRSRPLWELTLQLYLLAQTRDFKIRARHIPGRLNRLADGLSRANQVVNTEWTLAMPVARAVLDLWGSPTIDLMATSQTARLPVYISPFPDERALAVDAMSFDWNGMDAYIFPPWPMIALVLLKIRREPCVVTAILPLWPNRPWYPDLLDLLVERPRALPIFPKLVTMPHNKLLHGNLDGLALHAMRLSALPRLVRDFRRRCPSASPEDDTPLPRRIFTTQDGNGSRCGVVNGALIRSLPL